MKEKAFQDCYPDSLSYWDGDETVCTFYPEPYHMAVPGYVHGGLITSLIDCHVTGTAAVAAFRDEGRSMDTAPPLRFVTASLHVEYLRPTPLNGPIKPRGHVKDYKSLKVIVSVTLSARGKVSARGEVLAIRIPKHLIPDSS
ncbi:MAG: PaaI family thioesterase [Proteobacteria bacterium]|nr:PaaI family thioesterase [Pseudomonadota bacterium]